MMREEGNGKDYKRREEKRGEDMIGKDITSEQNRSGDMTRQDKKV